MEVFDLHHEPLQALWSNLSEVQRDKVLRLDAKLLEAHDAVRDLIGMGLANHLSRIKGPPTI